MVSNKKGISPVVATALLLVVAVVAVVGFQSWFGSFQSKINADVEQKSDTGVAITVERLESTGTDAKVYLKNSGSDSVTVTELSVENCTSTTSGSIGSDTVGNLSIASGCDLVDGQKRDVVVVTTEGVFQATMIVK